MSLFQDSYCLDFDHEIRNRQSGYSYPGTGRALLSGEEFQKRTTNRIRLLWFVVNNVDAQRNNVRQRASSGFNGNLNIPQRLSGLLSQISATDDLFTVIPGCLARDIDGRSTTGSNDLRKAMFQA